MNYKFVLIDNSNSEIDGEWVLMAPVVVGRCNSADITIDDISISRRHCQFFIDPYGSLVVRDLGSKNGIYVDEQRVDRAVVRPGTEVQIGRLTLRIELTEEAIDDDSENGVEILDLDETQRMKILDYDLEIGMPPNENV
ncbi:Glycogen accumulation regulator GarA [Novipirellula aureliae]|uniref:Glycogen accumulation regulator GarA n=1 Tax=Novipirellula aureliae TaxID=2527966 RepID=A0A5C6E4U2_9BACT|nr:FHA domain-containing protein [Novipirellula aureliae]TWU43952.1 Glycogen accumulation regulator GarA [Novipirellula aureliae]